MIARISASLEDRRREHAVLVYYFFGFHDVLGAMEIEQHRQHMMANMEICMKEIEHARAALTFFEEVLKSDECVA